MVDQHARSVGHETKDISVRVVAWFAVGLIVSAVIIHVTVAGLFHVFKEGYPSPAAPSRITEPQVLAPGPRLQIDTAADLDQFRADEEAKLNGYGWVDRNAGVIRIPIERSMELIATRGLPTRTGPGENGSGKTPTQMRQEKAAAIKP